MSVVRKHNTNSTHRLLGLLKSGNIFYNKNNGEPTHLKVFGLFREFEVKGATAEPAPAYIFHTLGITEQTCNTVNVLQSFVFPQILIPGVSFMK